jgi:hypothetical protein
MGLLEEPPATANARTALAAVIMNEPVYFFELVVGTVPLVV